MALNTITRNPNALKEKREAAIYAYYKTRGGSNSVSEWKNNFADYSFEKVLLNVVGNSCLERKVSEQIQEDLGIAAQGIMVPGSQFATRSDLNATTSNLGGVTIQSTIESDFFSGYLYPHSVAIKSGIRVVPAKGNVVIPVQSGTTNVSNTTENNPITDNTGLTFGTNVTMSPVRITGETIVSRQLIQQSSLDMIALVKEDLAKNLGATLDNYIFNGTLASQGFNGVFATSGTNVISTSSGNISWSTIASFEQALTQANHLLTDNSSVGWAVSPNVLR